MLDLSDLRGWLNPLFSDAESMARTGETEQTAWLPAIDLVRQDDALVVRADLPGVKPEDVSVEIDDDTLTISGRIEEEHEEKEENVIRRERRMGFFSRSIALPKEIERDQIEATVNEGILEVKIPTKSATEHRDVQVKTKSGGQ
jgi:HSP20 family protein